MNSGIRFLGFVATAFLVIAGPAGAAVEELRSGRDKVLRSGRTYLVTDAVELEGNVVFEAGTVVKFSRGGTSGITLKSGARLACLGEPYQPVILTASDDDSHGEKIPGSTGRPIRGGYAGVALTWNLPAGAATDLRLANLRIAHARQALKITGGPVALWHVQLKDCGVGIQAAGGSLKIRNLLFHDVRTNFWKLVDSRVDAQHLTIAGADHLNYAPERSTLSIIRSLATEVTDSSGFTNPPCEGTLNLFIRTPVTNLFVEVAGGLYLPPDSRRLRGGNCQELVDPELAAILPRMTLLPPIVLPPLIATNELLTARLIRDTDIFEPVMGRLVKLGFHHWPIDYLANGNVISNAVLSVEDGVMIHELDGGALRFIGSGKMRKEPARKTPATASQPAAFAMENPKRTDSDGDGINDAEEKERRTDPFDPYSSEPARLAVFGFDTPGMESEDGCPPLPGGSAKTVDSFDRFAAAFTAPGDVLRYPLVWTSGGRSITNLQSGHGTVWLDYSPDWYHGRTNDAPGAECVLFESSRLRISIDATGRRLVASRIEEFFELRSEKPLPRVSITNAPFEGRTNWTLEIPFSAALFENATRASHARTVSARAKTAFSIGNALDGGAPALGRIDRVHIFNFVRPGTFRTAFGDFDDALARQWSRSTLENDSISARSTETGVRLKFERVWEGDWNTGEKYVVERRSYSGSDESWKAISESARSGLFEDTTAQRGQTYGYRIHRKNRRPLQIIVAHDAAPPADRGRAILLIDETVARRIADSLAVYKRDLVADGWEVVEHTVARHADWNYGDWVCQQYDTQALPKNKAQMLAVKKRIRQEYEANRNRTNVVVLIGHVTIPQSGWAAEDGHFGCQDPAGIHVGAWNADAFYGDMTEGWTDVKDFSTGCPDCNRSQCKFCTIGNTANDGRWDQNSLPWENSTTPARIEVPLGRIDFAKLSNFDDAYAGLPGTPKDPAEIEVRLLERYFDKVHRYRLGAIPFENSAIGYANVLPALVEDNILHIAPRLWSQGPLPIATFNSDVFQTSTTHRWGFHTDYSHFGVIGQPGAAKAGHSHFAKNIAWRRDGDIPKVAFLFPFGSFMGQWFSGYGEDVLRACLASSDSVMLAGTASGFLPWITDRVHAGAPVHALLTDSAEYHTNVNARLVFLLGDPCLREQPIRAPEAFTAKKSGGTITLAWRPSPDADGGYRVMEAATLDAREWTEVGTADAGTTLLKIPAARRKRSLRLQALGSTTNLSGKYRQWSAPVYATSE
jgi:hypothetical protein